MENFIAKAMVGLGVIGNPSPENMALILAGHFDTELKCAAFFQQNRKHPENAEALEEPAVAFAVDRIKSFFRGIVQDIIRAGEKQIKIDIERAREERMKRLNAPHPMGTTAEIAERYGLSKSEVRKMKAAGTLESLTTLGAIIDTPSAD